MDRNILRQYLSGLAGANNRFLLENSRYLGNLPQNIVYNGLVYTLNLRENAFVNQFGHRIDPSAASAFITEARAFEQQNLAIMDISTASSDNGNSRGGEVPLDPVKDVLLINNPDNPTTSIIVEWNPPDSYVPDSYIVFRSTTTSGPFTEFTIPNPEINIFIDTGLTPGEDYFYFVKAVKGTKQSLSTETLELATLGVEPPLIGVTAPSGLTASSVTQTQLRLSWTDNSTNELGFFIYQSPDGLAFTQIMGVGAGITSANIKPLTQDTLYYYKVNAYATGSTSAFSNLISVRTLPTVPAAPTGLSLLVGGTSQIRVSWTDNSTNEQFFNLQRSIDGVSYPFGITLPAGSTTYLNTGLSAGQTYWYRVNAANTGGTSGFAGPAFAQTLPNPPAAPSNLRFNARTASRLGIEWNDNSTNETGFVIDYSTAGVTYVQLDTVGPNVVAYDAVGLSSGSTYFFRVAAFNSGGTSAFSGATSWQTLPLAPSVPTGLAAVVGSSANINLSWNDVANETGYELYRSLNGSSYTLLTTLGAGVTVFNNTGLNAETTYWYRLNAFNIGGTSDFTSAINATTLPAIPAVPSFTSISGTTNSITLNWNNVANETGYNLYRSTTLAGTYTGITTLGANVTTFVNTGLTSGTTFFYKIDAFNSGGTSALSGATSFTTLTFTPIPIAPSNLNFLSRTQTGFTLAWTDNSIDETGFILQSSANGILYNTIQTLAAGSTTTGVVGLSSGTTYFFQVAAFNGGGTSSFAGPTAWKTLPAAPSNFMATTGSTSSINLAWTDVTGEDGYVLNRGLTSAFTTFTGITLAANATAYSDTGLCAGTTYWYRIYSFLNDGGTSGFAGPTFAVTSSIAGTTPSAPTGFTAIDAGINSVTLQWNDTSTTEDGFVIYYREITKTPPEESRDPVVAMGAIPYNFGYDGVNIYVNPDSSNPNLLPSSTNLFTASSVPAGTVVFYVNNGGQPPASNKTGFTAPDGSTTAYEMVATSISSFMLNTTVVVEPGYTYYISYYHDLGRGPGTTGMGAPALYYYSPTRIIQTRQILPVVGSPGYGQQALYPTGPTAPTGWTRFAYEFYASPSITGNRAISLTLLGPGQGKTGYFWGPQLERAT